MGRAAFTLTKRTCICSVTVQRDGDTSDEETEEQKPALWVEKYAPRRYTELLSDEVQYTVIPVGREICTEEIH